MAGPRKGSRLHPMAQAIILELLRGRVSQSQIARTCRVSRDQVRQVAEDAGIVARRPSRGGEAGSQYVPVRPSRPERPRCGECGHVLL